MRDACRLRAAAEGVVRCQPAAVAQRQAGDVDGLAGADVLVRHRAGAAEREGFAVHQSTKIEDARRHIGRAVVDAAAGQVDRVGRDVGGGAARTRERVVARSVVAQGQARDGDGFGGAHVLAQNEHAAGEHAGSTGGVQSEGVARVELVVHIGGGTTGDRGGPGVEDGHIVGVVDLVVRGDARGGDRLGRHAHR